MDAKTIWTVVGYWPETGEAWVEYGNGSNEDEAVRSALSELHEGEANLEDLYIVAVFLGRQEDKLGCGGVTADFIMNNK